MISLTVDVYKRQTLEMNISNYKAQLEMLIGAEQTGNIQLQGLPQVTSQQLEEMDLEADLAAAKEVSYDLFAAQRTLEDAQEAFKDAGKDYNYNEKKYQYVSAQHTWESAQYTYQATLQSFENSFRSLYLQVKDYKPVSYTHLDVYKRQPSPWMKPPPTTQRPGLSCATLGTLF